MEVEEQRNAPAQNTDAPEVQAEPKKETEQATTPSHFGHEKKS
jgi:hypothetical protein